MSIELDIKEALESASENGYKMLRLSDSEIFDDMLEKTSFVYDYLMDGFDNSNIEFRKKEIIYYINKYRAR